MSDNAITRRETARATFELHMQTVPFSDEDASQPQQGHAVETTADSGGPHERCRSVGC